MSKSWHIVNALKEKGPMNQLQLWNSVKGMGDFGSRTGFKQVVNNLRKFERISAVPIADNINKTKDHLYMLTSKPSNFIPRAVSLVQVVKRREAGRQLRSFITEVNKAEKTLLEQYHATRPLEGAVYKNKLLQKSKLRQSAKNSRKNLRKVQAQTRLAKISAQDKKIDEARQQLTLTTEGKPKLKAQDNAQKRRLALELNRLMGSRRRVALLHESLVKRGQAKALKVRTRVKMLNRTGKPGTPERKAAVEKMVAASEKKDKRLSKWRASKKANYEKKLSISAQAPAAAVDLAKAFVPEVEAAPAAYLRETAKQKLEKERASEAKKAQSKKAKNVKK